MDDLTEEQLEKIAMVRLLIGDVEGSIFYPILSDEEIVRYLILENWDVMRAARRAATTVAFMLSTVSYRERTGDLEVWNNASIEYRKVLEMFLDESGSANLPANLKPYAAGISVSDVEAANCNPDRNRSPLARITPCLAWWTRVKDYPCCDGNDGFLFK